MPAPLPPYALEAFVPLSKLSFARATFLWTVVIVLSAIAVVIILAELTTLPLLLIAVCVFPTLLQTVRIGGLAGLPIALLCLSAFAIARRRYTVSAILIAIATVEPHVALPAALGAFLLVPKMRVQLLIAGCVAVAMCALAGAGLTQEYFTAVLPAHAFSEAGTPAQYSLTSLLYSLGVPISQAIALGTWQYAAFVVAGVYCARGLQQRGFSAAVVLAPAAFAVAGGTFIHTTQIAVALPLAILVANRLRSAQAWTAVALLAIPWETIAALGSSPLNFSDVRASGTDLAETAWRALAVQVPFDHTWLITHLLLYGGLALLYWNVFVLVLGKAKPGPGSGEHGAVERTLVPYTNPHT